MDLAAAVNCMMMGPIVEKASHHKLGMFKKNPITMAISEKRVQEKIHINCTILFFKCGNFPRSDIFIQFSRIVNLFQIRSNFLPGYSGLCLDLAQLMNLPFTSEQ